MLSEYASLPLIADYYRRTEPFIPLFILWHLFAMGAALLSDINNGVLVVAVLPAFAYAVQRIAAGTALRCLPITHRQQRNTLWVAGFVAPTLGLATLSLAEFQLARFAGFKPSMESLLMYHLYVTSMLATALLFIDSVVVTSRNRFNTGLGLVWIIAIPAITAAVLRSGTMPPTVWVPTAIVFILAGCLYPTFSGTRGYRRIVEAISFFGAQRSITALTVRQQTKLLPPLPGLWSILLSRCAIALQFSAIALVLMLLSKSLTTPRNAPLGVFFGMFMLLPLSWMVALYKDNYLRVLRTLPIGNGSLSSLVLCTSLMPAVGIYAASGLLSSKPIMLNTSLMAQLAITLGIQSLMLPYLLRKHAPGPFGLWLGPSWLLFFAVGMQPVFISFFSMLLLPTGLAISLVLSLVCVSAGYWKLRRQIRNYLPAYRPYAPPPSGMA